ncbi:MAG: lipopolysaccharide heptosyltransferase II [bacterium]|nr:lipopolysaccharide heptosyltransferase II [bacterium]
MWDEAPSSVLVIQTAFIGDVVLVIPLLAALYDAWPTTSLDVMVRPPANNLLETLPFLRQVISYDKYGDQRGFGSFIKLSNKLKKIGYDLALVPHRSLRSGVLARLAGIPRRIGFNRGAGRFFHSTIVPYDQQLHEIDRNLSLLSAIQITGASRPPQVVSSEEDLHVVDRLLPQMKGEDVIALAPGSAWLTKCWPDESYIAIGRLLMQDGFRLLLVGGKEDTMLCDRIQKALNQDCQSMAGQTTPRQTIEALRRCRLLISNDSAPTHFGVAAGCKVLTLFGSTSPKFGFGPYGSANRSFGIDLYCRPCTDHGRNACPEAHFRCMKELSPEMVFNQVKEMLSARELS